jgi:hypothetical protein
MHLDEMPYNVPVPSANKRTKKPKKLRLKADVLSPSDKGTQAKEAKSLKDYAYMAACTSPAKNEMLQKQNEINFAESKPNK